MINDTVKRIEDCDSRFESKQQNGLGFRGFGVGFLKGEIRFLWVRALDRVRKREMCGG